MMRAKTMKSAVILFLISALYTSVAIASVDPQAVAIRDILTQQNQLRAQVSAGKGAFKDLSKPERSRLLERQAELMTLLRGVNTMDELRPDQRIVVFNSLEWIKATVTRAEDDRQVCEYVRAVGSNLPKAVCTTARAQRENRESARRSLEQATTCMESCIGILIAKPK